MKYILLTTMLLACASPLTAGADTLAERAMYPNGKVSVIWQMDGTVPNIRSWDSPKSRERIEEALKGSPCLAGTMAEASDFMTKDFKATIGKKIAAIKLEALQRAFRQGVSAHLANDPRVSEEVNRISIEFSDSQFATTPILLMKYEDVLEYGQNLKLKIEILFRVQERKGGHGYIESSILNALLPFSIRREFPLTSTQTCHGWNVASFDEVFSEGKVLEEMTKLGKAFEQHLISVEAEKRRKRFIGNELQDKLGNYEERYSAPAVQTSGA